MTIDIYRTNGKFTFTPGAARPHTSIEVTSPCNIDFDRDLLIVPGVHAPEFTPGAALLSATAGYFGMRVVETRMSIDEIEPTSTPPRKGRKRK
jgi:hypothetical protein